MKGTIRRNRPKEEMVQVFWDNLEAPKYLAWSLWYEILTCQDEGETDSRWCERLRKAVRELSVYDYGRLRRTIRQMAEDMNVELKNR